MHHLGSELTARLKRWSALTAAYCAAYKNAPWRQELFDCWPATVEQFTSGVAPVTR